MNKKNIKKKFNKCLKEIKVEFKNCFKETFKIFKFILVIFNFIKNQILGLFIGFLLGLPLILFVYFTLNINENFIFFNFKITNFFILEYIKTIILPFFIAFLGGILGFIFSDRYLKLSNNKKFLLYIVMIFLIFLTIFYYLVGFANCEITNCSK